MMPTTTLRLLLPFFVLFAATSAAEPREKIAVIEFQNPAGLTEQEVSYITDLARGAASRLPSTRYFVMTRENILEQLPPGVDLSACVGECEVETGRNVGADYVMSGEVIRFGRSLKVSMKLHETGGGALLGTERASGAQVDALEEPVVKAATRLFSRLAGGRVAPAASSATDYSDLERLAAEEEALVKQQEALRVQREKLRRARLIEHHAAVEAEWEQVARIAARASGAGCKAVKRFRERFDGHELGNPRAPEARELEGRSCGRGGVVQAGTTGVEWVRIPGGSFQMGSSDGDDDEKPVHLVRVGTFELAKSEVTVAQYGACVTAGKCTAPDECNWGEPNWGKSGREQHPVNCVDWEQARAFSAWVGGRLPTEAEWEFAARSGGKARKYPWGNEQATCSRAVMDDGGDGCGKSATWPVCSKPSGDSAQGVCDLAGNVWEWVEDVHADSYAGAPTDGSARAGGGSYRVFRGGSWGDTAGYLRAAFRVRFTPGRRSGYLGFRPARSSH